MQRAIACFGCPQGPPVYRSSSLGARLAAAAQLLLLLDYDPQMKVFLVPSPVQLFNGRLVRRSAALLHRRLGDGGLMGDGGAADSAFVYREFKAFDSPFAALAALPLLYATLAALLFMVLAAPLLRPILGLALRWDDADTHHCVLQAPAPAMAGRA